MWALWTYLIGVAVVFVGLGLFGDKVGDDREDFFATLSPSVLWPILMTYVIAREIGEQMGWRK